MILEFINSFIGLFMESAPYLLLGLLIAGIIKQMVPEAWIQKVLGTNSSVTTAALIGAPIPLCSCSVIPTAIGIRRAGASKASTASFMVATPETGVDSIGVTLALMNPVMAIARPIAAISSAIVAGKLVQIWDKETPAKSTDFSSSVSSCCNSKANPLESKQPEPQVAESTACCSTKAQPAISETAKPEITSCCASKSQPVSNKKLISKITRAVQYGYGKLLSDFMTWLLIGLFFAALIQTFVPTNFFIQYGNSVWGMLLIILISIPMYICATSSTPIAVGLMLSGISPGAALVFMLAGPATNIATLMVVKNELGKRSLAAYLIGVIVTAVLSGLLLDKLIEYFGWDMQVSISHHHEMTSPLYIGSAVILSALISLQYIKKVRKKL